MVVSMSEKEFSRLSVLMDAQAGRLRIDDAARELWRKLGDDGVKKAA